MADNKYKAEYAKTGRSSCKLKKCASKNIPKGSLRIGKVKVNPFDESGGLRATRAFSCFLTILPSPLDTVMVEWYHPHCWFNTQKRMRKTSKKIENSADIEGFATLEGEEQQLLLDLISGMPRALPRRFL